MNESKISLLAVVCAAFTALMTATSCATSDNRPVDTASERPALKKKKKKKEKAGEYQLYGKKKELDAKILKRGERAQYAPALDSY